MSSAAVADRNVPYSCDSCLHRVEEVLDVEREREQRRDLDGALEVQVAAVAEHDRERDRREQVDEREVRAAEDDRLLVRLAVALADLAEVADVHLLARERLDDPHAGDVLGERRRDQPESLAHGPVRAGRVAPEEERCRRSSPGSRASVASASRQSRKNSRIAVPMRVSVLWTRLETPSVTSWSSASTSFVRRLMIDAGAVPLVEAERQPLQVAEELPRAGRPASARRPSRSGRSARRSCPSSGARRRRNSATIRPSRLLPPSVDRVVEGGLGQERRRERDQRSPAGASDDRQDRAAAVRGDEAVQRREPPPRLPPRPVAHARAPRSSVQVASRLVDPHATSSTTARASTASANWRSSRPCS